MLNNPSYRSGLARLYDVLACIRVYPIPLTFVCIVAGLSEQDALNSLTSSPYVVIDGQVLPRQTQDWTGQTTIGDAAQLYQDGEIATYCVAGVAAWQFVDDTVTPPRQHGYSTHKKTLGDLLDRLGRPGIQAIPGD